MWIRIFCIFKGSFCIFKEYLVVFGLLLPKQKKNSKYLNNIIKI